MSAIRLRFVQSEGWSSDLIEYREGTVMPFCPSHVECVDGDDYIGQHMLGGMQARPKGYDAPFNFETFVDLPCTDEQHDEFYRWARAAIGEPYDWSAIIGFALPGHHHVKFHAICSAKIFLGLRHVNWVSEQGATLRSGALHQPAGSAAHHQRDHRSPALMQKAHTRG